jgi:hypothetical protein
MKYLKYFQEESEYTEYKSSSDYVTPNVSYVVEGNFVDYKAYVIEKLIMQVGNKYPEIKERFKSMVNKYFPSAISNAIISNAINDLLNNPEVPEYIKDWKYICEISNSGKVSIDPVYDQSNESYSTDNYVLTFDIDVMFYDPSIDIDNINWEDPSIEEKIISDYIEVSQLLSSEDNDFIKSISVDGELGYTSRIYLHFNIYDENGNYVGNQGVFNELESIELYCNRWYFLSSLDDYELMMEPQPE